jgi:hypothetical protein
MEEKISHEEYGKMRAALVVKSKPEPTRNLRHPQGGTKSCRP